MIIFSYLFHYIIQEFYSLAPEPKSLDSKHYRDEETAPQKAPAPTENIGMSGTRLFEFVSVLVYPFATVARSVEGQFILLRFPIRFFDKQKNGIGVIEIMALVEN